MQLDHISVINVILNAVHNTVSIFLLSTVIKLGRTFLVNERRDNLTDTARRKYLLVNAATATFELTKNLTKFIMSRSIRSLFFDFFEYFLFSKLKKRKIGNNLKLILNVSNLTNVFEQRNAFYSVLLEP